MHCNSRPPHAAPVFIRFNWHDQRSLKSVNLHVRSRPANLEEYAYKVLIAFFNCYKLAIMLESISMVQDLRHSLGSPADSGGWEETTGVLKTVWTRKPSVPRAVWDLSPANATIANVAHWPASAFSPVKFVCQRVDVQQTAA